MLEFFKPLNKSNYIEVVSNYLFDNLRGDDKELQREKDTDYIPYIPKLKYSYEKVETVKMHKVGNYQNNGKHKR